MAKTLRGDVALQRASKPHECYADDCNLGSIDSGDRYFRVILDNDRVEKFHFACYYRLFHEKG